MQPIATDVAYSAVCVFGTRVSCVKTAEPIEMLFAGRVGADRCGQL